MRISDWSSDVCSSDLGLALRFLSCRTEDGRSGSTNLATPIPPKGVAAYYFSSDAREGSMSSGISCRSFGPFARDRKSVVSGKRVSDRVDPGGRRFFTKKYSLQSYIAKSPLLIS